MSNSEERSKKQTDMVHVSSIQDILMTGKITCRKCHAVFGVYVFNQYVDHSRLICRECGTDNSKKVEGE